MAAFSLRLSLPAAHGYVRAPADMHPRLVRLTSPNTTNTGLIKSLSQNPPSGGTGVSPVRFIMALRSHGESFARARRPCHRFRDSF